MQMNARGYPTDHCPLATAVYNLRKPEMLVPSSRVRWALCVLLLLSQIAHASDWHQPEAQLSEKIAAVTGPGVIALEVSNRSSISASDVEIIRRELTNFLATSVVHACQPAQAAGLL